MRGGQSMNLALCFVWPLLLDGKQKGKKLIWVALFTAYLLLFYMKNFSNDPYNERLLVPYNVEISSIFR